jgi:hypothetical protein
MEGWVEKESRHIGSWRQRYLVLHEDSNELCTYSHAALLSQSAPIPSERILLASMTIVQSAGMQAREYVFVVRTGGRDFRFSCGSASARDRWVEVMQSKTRTALPELGTQSTAGSMTPLASLEAAGSGAAGPSRPQTPEPVEYIAVVAGGRADMAEKCRPPCLRTASLVAAWRLQGLSPLLLTQSEAWAVSTTRLASLAADEIAARLGLLRSEVEAVPPPPPEEQWSPPALQLGQRVLICGSTPRPAVHTVCWLTLARPPRFRSFANQQVKYL